MQLRGLEAPASLAASRTGTFLVQGGEYTTLPVLVTAFLWLTGTRQATLLQACLALVLMQIAWGSWLRWKAKPERERDFPLFALVAGMYWMAFGLPLLWAPPWFAGGTASSSGAITRSLELAIVGVSAMYGGIRLGIGRRLRFNKTLDLRDTPSSPRYIAAVMVFALGLRFFPWLGYIFGSASRNVFMIATSTLPLAAFAILLRRQLLRRVPIYELLLVVVFVAGTFLSGLASGWLGTGAVAVLVTGCVLVDTRFKIPKLALVAVFAYVLFLQPVKEQFRQTYWQGDRASGRADRALDWVSSARSFWEDALTGSNPAALKTGLGYSLARFALLPQTANVMDLTPAIIPYQGGRMYSYLAVSLIPRAIWPEKPSVNDANRFYQVTYGMTSENNLEGVSISVGMLTEAYISYGWPGVLVVMMLVGMFLDAVNAVFLSRHSGTLMKGIGMGMMPSFIFPEAQMAQFLGGFFQQVGLVMMIMLPIVSVRRGHRDAATAPGSGRQVSPAAMLMRPTMRPPQPLS